MSNPNFQNVYDSDTGSPYTPTQSYSPQPQFYTQPPTPTSTLQEDAPSTTGLPEAPHPIALRVMRLRKPDFTMRFPVVTERSDLIEMTPTIDNSFLNKVDYKEKGLDAFGFLDQWSLPSSFGKIYVGETFSSFISLHNHSYNPIQNVIVRIELYSENQKHVLLDLTNSPIETFPAKSNKNFIVEQPLSQDARHILVCTITYTHQSHHHSTNFVTNQVRSFRKLFPFVVSNPLGMNSVKVYTFQEHVFVHLELQNLTHGPLYVDTVKLDPSFQYDLVPHCTHNTTGEPYEHAMLKGEVRRFLYELIPKNAINENKSRGPNVPMTSLGKIELQWKGTCGESGILITSPIQHRPVIKQEIELTLQKHEDQKVVEAEKPFKVTCNVFNRSSRPVNLALKFDPSRMFPIAVDGKSIQTIGQLEPYAMKQVDISLFALQTGVHNVGSGIVLVDELTNTPYPTNLCQIYVHPPAEPRLITKNAPLLDMNSDSIEFYE